VRASIAHTCSGTVKYRMPFTSSGVDLMACELAWNAHASVSDFTFEASICFSGL
jgi:hypothetical protein